jgi:hypothetical protein
MKNAIWIAALALAGCDSGMPAAAKTPTTTVTLTSVAFAEDCGGTPPAQAPAQPPARRAPAKTAAVPSSPAAMEVPADQAPGNVAVQRRCEQTSMQLAVVAEAATELHIKSVEVVDDKGKSLGALTASKPTRWDDNRAAYEPWDERVAAGTMSVSYVLSQPTFVNTWDERDRTYTVKVIATVGSAEQSLKTTVLVVGRPPPVPT